MILRCSKCGASIDIKSRAAIELYLKGEFAVGCKECGEVIYSEAALTGPERND